jgi:site-specific DNA recombinase
MVFGVEDYRSGNSEHSSELCHSLITLLSQLFCKSGQFSFLEELLFFLFNIALVIHFGEHGNMKSLGSGQSVGIWIRVSTDDQAKGESPEHHEKRARAYAEIQGWIVTKVYHLEGVSGKAVSTHPEAERMLKDIETGTIKALIFSKLARLARNTVELLTFAERFKSAGADLVSLQESIDTSTPAGRLFFTMIAAMAQWEREEIVDRVKASIRIRAQLGKTLGGAAPFGYQWKDKKLIIDPTEGPIRQRMYELYAEHKRNKTVARLLNDAGYRTRNGSKFSDTTVLRLIQDTTAKGIYRANHTYRDGKGKLHLKPEAEWILTKVDRLISDDLWETCNSLITSRTHGNQKRARKTVHLFAGLIYCSCGQKMYVFSRSPKYICRKCKRKIPMEDMEAIFREQLEDYFVSPEKIQKHLEVSNEELQSKKQHLDNHIRELETVRAEMQKTYKLYQADQITVEGFGPIYKPLEVREKQLSHELAKLQGAYDSLKISRISADEVIKEATTLHKIWPRLGPEEKRRIVESVTERIVLGDKEIDISLSYLPSSEELIKRQRNLSDSSPPPA